MNDPVIDRISREDPAREQTSQRAEKAATRTRVFAAVAQEPTSMSPAHPRRGMLLAGGASVVLVAAVVVVVLLASGHRAPRSAPAVGNHGTHRGTGVPTEPVQLYALGTVNVGATPQALLAYANSLWVASPQELVRLDLHNGRTIARTPLPTNGVTAGLASGAGSVWLAATGSDLLRIDPTNNRLTATIRLGEIRNGRTASVGGGVAFAKGRAWVTRDTDRPRGDVVAVNPSTNQPTGEPVTVGSGPDAIVPGFGSLWVDNTSTIVGSHTGSQVYQAMSRIDPTTRHVTTERFAGIPAIGFGSLWVITNAEDNDATVLRVDPNTGQPIAQIPMPRVTSLAFGDGRVWAICGPKSRSSRTFQPIKGTAALRQIDAQTNHATGTPIHLPVLQPMSIVVSKNQLWIADYRSREVTHFRLIDH